MNHPIQQRYIVFPTSIWQLVEEEEIDLTDLRLLNLIDIYTKPNEPCWASNTHIANKLGRSKRDIQYRIKRLTELGLIVFKGWKQMGTKRLHQLETSWARVPMNVDRGAKSCTSRGAEKCTQSSVIVLEDDISASPASPPKALSPSKSFNFGQNKQKQNLAKPPQQCIDWANRYIRILRSKSPPIPVNAGYLSWASEFQWLWKEINQDSGRIDQFLDKYEICINQIEKPILCTIKSFRNNFNWLEQSVKEVEKKTEGDLMKW